MMWARCRSVKAIFGSLRNIHSDKLPGTRRLHRFLWIFSRIYDQHVSVHQQRGFRHAASQNVNHSHTRFRFCSQAGLLMSTKCFTNQMQQKGEGISRGKCKISREEQSVSPTWCGMKRWAFLPFTFAWSHLELAYWSPLMPSSWFRTAAADFMCFYLFCNAGFGASRSF